MPKSENTVANPNRRNLLMAGGATAIVAAVPVRPGLAADNKRMTLVSWGGAYREAVERAVVKPFMEETGIRVTIVDTPDLAKLHAQIQSNNVQWDVFDAPNALGVAGVNAGFWEPLDMSLFDRDDLVVDIQNDLVPWYLFVGGIAWDPKRYPAGKHPRNFAEYFDLQKFPGLRTFRNRPSETLGIF